jgi:uncharacterized protein (TIGR03083 family)
VLSSFEPLRQETRLALVSELEAFAALAESVPPQDATRSVPGLRWTVAELVAHVDTVMLRGHADRRRSASPEETAELNEVTLAETSERDLHRLAERIREHGAASLAVFDRIPGDVVIDFHAGSRAPVMALWAYVVAELMVHRYDLGEAVGSPQVLDPDRFLMTGYAASAVLSAWVEPAAAAGPAQRWAYAFPPGQVLTVRVGDGEAFVDFPDGEATQSVDDPTQFLLTFPFRRRPPTDPELAALVAAFHPL